MRREFHVRFCEGPGVQSPRATRLVIIFEWEADARRVMEVLPKRFGRYGLTLHPEKTRLVKFHRPRSAGRNGDDDGEGPGSFDFLGFTHRWEKSRKGTMVVRQETARSRFTRGLKRIREWCRLNRHRPVSEQSKMLGLKLRGHYNYYGLAGNSRALKRYANEVRRVWEKWLARRSQSATSRWERFRRIFRRFPLPAPRLIHRSTQLKLSETLV